MTTKTVFAEFNSWSDFQTKLLSFNKKEKGDAFELLTKLYFKINPVFDFYDEIWLLSEVPQKTLEYLGIPSHDLGIDLIAKNGDEYHAIQCKFHTEINSSVSFKEVATFISLLEGNKKFTQGYICSSANITSRNFEKIETKPITTILADTWQNLDKDFFDKARKFLNKEKFSPVAYKPKEHQVKALNQAVNYFVKENNTRGKLIFPCGAGKSLTGYWLTQELKSKATIIAVPSLSLVKQTLDVYLREIVAEGKKVKWLCICSDEGIGTGEDIVFKTENIGVPCQTDPVYIENWLLENKNENIVIFTTYQSGRIIAEISRNLNFSFNVGIFDEAHKTVGSDKKLFSHLLFEENISIGKRIFMTATERFYAGYKDDIISMDDEDLYGGTFAQMSFKEAIEMELLTDYKVITIDVKKSEIADFIKDNNLVQLNDKWKKETEARSLASMLALRKAMKLFPIKNAVSFHSSIDKAVRNKELQSYITDTYHYDPIDTFTVSGKMPTTKRNIIVKEFADSPRSLITNARCLTEGVDVPNIDCIVFADPRKSKVDIVQALGRALRKKEGKDWGYVILPVVYDDITQEIDNENFNEILAIVRGLASNDDRIIEYFKDKKDGIKSNKKEKIDQFQFEVFSDYIDANQLSEQLQIKLWKKLSRFDWLPFEVAREYVRGLNLISRYDWEIFSRTDEKPFNIPSVPSITYKDTGWNGWGNWLGTGSVANKFKKFLPFDEARDLVKNMGLKSEKEFREFIKNKGDLKIPSGPARTYKNEGWLSMGDFLGTERIADQLREYKSFNDAKIFAHTLGLKSRTEWRSFCKSGKKPSLIPANPDQVYKSDGWISFGDFLGTGTISPRLIIYRSFNEARKFVQSLGLKTVKEWEKYCRDGKRPNDIPSHPSNTYKKKGWVNWGDWLGTGNLSVHNKDYLSFDNARDFVRKLSLKSWKEWQSYCKNGSKPKNIPNSPHFVYKNDGWISTGDWLGTFKVANYCKEYLDYQEAKLIVNSLNLKSFVDWKKFCKSGQKPNNIPANPYGTYKNKGWTNAGDWLGTRNVASYNLKFRDFNSARNFVQKLELQNWNEWKTYCKTGLKPKDIPANPSSTYKNIGWISVGDWLGTYNVARAKKQYKDFQSSRKTIRNLGLRSSIEWRKFCKSSHKPDDIPSNPDKFYKISGWVNWADFLGKEE